VSTNLTVGPTATVRFLVVAGGSGAVGVPVRFVPLPSYPNASESPIAALVGSTSNGSVFVSNAAGVVSATLPVGNYSVYALAYVDGSLQSALTSVAAFPGLPSSLTPLPLGPTADLSGTVAQVGPVTNTTKTAVLVYGSGLSEVTTWAGANGTYSVRLPLGNYTVLALQGATTSGAGITAALTSVVLDAPTVLPLQPVGAIQSRFSVGSLLPDGTLFPAVAAEVSVSAGPAGPTVPTLASGNGTVAFYLPSSIPLAAGGYCLSAASAGFDARSECGLTATGLTSMSQLPLTLRSVSVRLTVTGLPSGTPVQVNFTALGAPGTNRTFSGGPTFTFATTPGPYTVSARAVIGGGTVVYLPSSLLNTTIPLGAYSSDLTLRVVPAVNASGTLLLPRGAVLGNVTVALSSSLFNVTVNGTNFIHRFVAAPATYSAHTTLRVGGVNYTNVSRVTVSPGGTVSPSISLLVAGVSVTGHLTNASGTTVPLNLTLTLTSPDLAAITVPVVDGSFATTLPANTTFAASGGVTAPTVGFNGTFFVTYSTAPGASCATSSTPTTCSIPLTAVPNLVWLNGTLVARGVPGLQPGTVRLAGPFPLTTVTTVTTSNGTFSALLVPGAYSLFATAGGPSSPFANLTTVLALPSSAPVAVQLQPAWSTAVRVSGPNGTAATLGPATITLRNVFGTVAVYPGVSIGASVPLDLPVGTYTVFANATGAPYGVAANATGSGILTVSSGNQAFNVTLAYVFSYRVAATLVGSTSETVAAGGQATFQFTVRNSGSAPVTVHPVGSPSYWTFNYSFSNVSLAPGPRGATFSASVVVHVPRATVVLHPPILLELELANGTLAGTVAPAPTVHVLGYYGVAVGPAAHASPTVSSTHALVPFFLINTGNVYEAVRLTVVDQLRITSLGWLVSFRTANGTLTGPAGLNPGINSTEEVNLTATSAIFVPVGSVTVSAIVLNASGAVSAATTLVVPLGTVAPGGANGSPPFVVTGPGVAAPPAVLPDWLVPLLSFVPAIALTAFLLVRRWLRTRRWTRR
jgi:hypothetical protein